MATLFGRRRGRRRLVAIILGRSGLLACRGLVTIIFSRGFVTDQLGRRFAAFRDGELENAVSVNDVDVVLESADVDFALFLHRTDERLDLLLCLRVLFEGVEKSKEARLEHRVDCVRFTIFLHHLALVATVIPDNLGPGAEHLELLAVLRGGHWCRYDGWTSENRTAISILARVEVFFYHFSFFRFFYIFQIFFYVREGFSVNTDSGRIPRTHSKLDHGDMIALYFACMVFACLLLSIMLWKLHNLQFRIRRMERELDARSMDVTYDLDISPEGPTQEPRAENSALSLIVAHSEPAHPNP